MANRSHDRLAPVTARDGVDTRKQENSEVPCEVLGGDNLSVDAITGLGQPAVERGYCGCGFLREAREGLCGYCCTELTLDPNRCGKCQYSTDKSHGGLCGYCADICADCGNSIDRTKNPERVCDDCLAKEVFTITCAACGFEVDDERCLTENLCGHCWDKEYEARSKERPELPIWLFNLIDGRLVLNKSLAKFYGYPHQ